MVRKAVGSESLPTGRLGYRPFQVTTIVYSKPGGKLGDEPEGGRWPVEAYLKDGDLSLPHLSLSSVFWPSPHLLRLTCISDLILNLEFRMASQARLVIFLCLWKESGMGDSDTRQRTVREGPAGQGLEAGE